MQQNVKIKNIKYKIKQICNCEREWEEKWKLEKF